MGNVRRKTKVVAMFALLVVTSACTEQAEITVTPDTNPSSTIATDFRPGATLQEIMLAVIDPNIDPIWNSISTVSTAEGVTEIRPETDEDWAILHNHAVTLSEVANLLVIPNRKVAHPETSTSTHHTELHAEAIEGLIAAQWPAFVARAHALQDAANLAIKAIDEKNVDRLEEVGDLPPIK